MNKDRDDLFYICLPEGSNGHDIPALLRHTARAIREKNNADRVHISALYMRHSPNSDDIPTALVHYWVEDDDERRRRRESEEWAKDYKVSAASKSVEYFAPKGERVVNGFIYRLPQGDAQGDSLLLLEKAADYIDQLGKVEVLDVTYVDIADKDALDHPELHVYYMAQM